MFPAWQKRDHVKDKVSHSSAATSYILRSMSWVLQPRSIFSHKQYCKVGWTPPIQCVFFKERNKYMNPVAILTEVTVVKVVTVVAVVTAVAAIVTLVMVVTSSNL